MARPPLGTANSARDAANRMRAEGLIALTRGRVDLHKFIELACKPEGKPLLRVTVKQMLMAQEGVGEDSASRVVRHVQTVTDTTEVPARRITLAWLLDARAGGRRFMAFCDAISDNSRSPWPGFPYTPRPQRGR